MADQLGFFDADERLQWLSAAGDPLERLAAMVDVAPFRSAPEGPADRGRHRCKSHVGIDRKHGFVRRFNVTDTAARGDAQFGAVLDPANYWEARLDRRRLPLGRQHRDAGEARPGSPSSNAASPGASRRRASLPAARQARAHPVPRRACLRRLETPIRPAGPRRRQGKGDREARARQPRLQLQTFPMAGDATGSLRSRAPASPPCGDRTPPGARDPPPSNRFPARDAAAALPDAASAQIGRFFEASPPPSGSGLR